MTYPGAPSAPGVPFAVQYNYSGLGFLQYVSDVADNKPYWVVLAMNALGQVTDEQTRNGVETLSNRSAATGWLLGSTSTAHGINDTPIQQWKNTFDEAGNLHSRARYVPVIMGDSVESFGYDKLDRVTSSDVKVGSEGYFSSETFDYDILGNLKQKGGKTYAYAGCAAGGGPHAVCQVGDGERYAYDEDGNMTGGNGRKVFYNPFNKVAHIEGKQSGDSLPTVDFLYSADSTRVVQSVGSVTSTAGSNASSTAAVARTVYVGMGTTGKTLYERTQRGTTTEHVHFLYAGGLHSGNAFALRVVSEDSGSKTNPVTTFKYNQFDHLGSVTAVSDEVGRVRGPEAGADTTLFGYDAWGTRRSPDGRAAAVAYSLAPGHREFTSHETIPEVGLVNMNGRVYDPEVGRFLSPDPNVQFVKNLQSFNRYSYAGNNPLRYTDPTGYTWEFLSSGEFWVTTIEAIGVAVCTAATDGACACPAMFLMFQTAMLTYAHTGSLWRTAVMAAASYVGGQLGAAAGTTLGGAAFGAVAGGAIGGAVSAAITTRIFGGNLGESVMMGAVMGAVMGAASAVGQGLNPVSVADAGQPGETYKRFLGDADAPKSGALEAEMKAHPVFTYEDENGYSHLTGYWLNKLQPFYQGRNLDLAEVWVHFRALSGDGEGMTNYGAQNRVVNIDQSLDTFGKLDSFLHESMHLVEGDQIGAWGSGWRTLVDKLTFGPTKESQYNWRNYSELYGASYNEISATGGGSYPIEAGFNRFSVGVVNNLDACGGVCP